MAPRVEATLTEVALTMPARFATTADPVPASDGRALAPLVDTRVGPEGVGDATELRVGGTVGLEPEVARVVVVLADVAPPTDGRAEVTAAVGLVAVDDNEGLLLCPRAGATEVRRARGSDDTPGLLAASALVLALAAAVGLEATDVEPESGDLFAAVPGVGSAGLAREVLKQMNQVIVSYQAVCNFVVSITTTKP